MAVNGEPDTALLLTRHPTVSHGDDSGTILSDALEDGLGEVEVVEGRVAPPAGIVWEGIIRGTEVGGGDGDGSGEAPFAVAVALDLEARAATESVVVQGRAQSRRIRAVALAVQITIATSSS